MTVTKGGHGRRETGHERSTDTSGDHRLVREGVRIADDDSTAGAIDDGVAALHAGRLLPASSAVPKESVRLWILCDQVVLRLIEPHGSTAMKVHGAAHFLQTGDAAIGCIRDEDITTHHHYESR